MTRTICGPNWERAKPTVRIDTTPIFSVHSSLKALRNLSLSGTVEARQLLGKVPYLNGGIFQRHQIEELHGERIQIPDARF